MNHASTVADNLIGISTQVPGFDVRDYTSAPLRIRADYQFDVEPNLLFQRITDPSLIAQWFDMVKSGDTDHSQSQNRGAWGAGSKRFCHTRMMGTLDETIYYWDEPKVVAYNVKSWSMPVKDHCAVMIIKPVNRHRSELTWLQYFNPKGLLMGRVMPKMMCRLMTKGLEALRKDLGGPGGGVKQV